MPLHRDELPLSGATYWWVVAVAAVFTLARFSEAFLILRAQSIGFSVTVTPLSGCHEPCLLPFGLSSWCAVGSRQSHDPSRRRTCPSARSRPRACIRVGDIVWVGIGVVLWGLHMGFTQGLLATLIAERALPPSCGEPPSVCSTWCRDHTARSQCRRRRPLGHDGAAGHIPAGAAFALLTLAGLFVIRGRLGSSAVLPK